MCHLKLFRESRGQGQRIGGNYSMSKRKVPSAPAADANLLAWLKKPKVPPQEGIDRIKRICSPKQANFAKHM